MTVPGEAGTEERPVATPEIVVPNEMAKDLGVQPLRLRNWLRAQRAAGHPLLAAHSPYERWRFSRGDADRLIAEYRAASDTPTAPGSTQASESAVQLRAETAIREQLEHMLGTKLEPRTLRLAGGATVAVDAAASDNSLIAEIFARQGRLKPGQQKKVAIDAFKLVTIGREHPRADLVLVFADSAAAAYATGDGWLAYALRAWDVRVMVVEIDAGLRAEIRAAQHRQRMVNAGDVADDVALAKSL